LPFFPEAALSTPAAISLTCALKLPTPLAALATSLELTLIFGLRGIALLPLESALLIPPLRPFLEAARAMPPAAPATAAPPATSGTFALLATLPTVLPADLPAPFALPPMSPTALRTASTFECLLDEPFEPEAPLLELRDLPLDLGFAFACDFEAFDFGDDLDFVAGFADFEVDDFFDFDFGFDLDFVFELGVDLVLV